MRNGKKWLLVSSAASAAVGVGLTAAALGGTFCRPRHAHAAALEAEAHQVSPQDAARRMPDHPARPLQTAQCGPSAKKEGANPCAAKKPNPCGAKANPCAAKNPCGTAKGGCNPCAAGAAAASAKCVVPRLAKANPCAAKPPGAAKKTGPCAPKKASPCGAKANPCAAKNPCGAKATGPNPCSPCAGADVAEITNEEALKTYTCMMDEMQAAYAKSGQSVAKAYATWDRYNTVAYQSATHGSRYVNNYVNSVGKAYGRFEKVGKMPAGAQIAKDSFVVSPDGKVSVGPLFLMEKMKPGFNAESGDWKYTMVMPDGTIAGVTKGKGSENVKFCAGCHMASADTDSLMFMPEEYRRKK